MEQLEFIINGGETKRYHTWPMLREQNVAAHSFGVAMIYSMLAGQDGAPESGGLSVPGLMAALTHDLAEHKMGDLPAPAKRLMPDTISMEGDKIYRRTFRASWGKMEQDLLDEQGLSWEGMLAPHEMRWLKAADAMDGALYCIRERQMGNQTIAAVFVNFRSYIREISSGEAGPCEMEIINYIDDMWEQANVGR